MNACSKTSQLCSQCLQDGPRPMRLARQLHSSAACSVTAARKESDSISSGPLQFEISPRKNNPAFEYNKENNAKNGVASIPSFKNLGLKDEVVQGLESMQISQPTVIQLKCIPEILKGSNVFCAAQTGSGKTLAYLAPILHKLKLEEEKGLLARYRRPRVCIVSPFRELAMQILKVVKMMSHHVPVRSLGLIGGQKDSLMHKGLKENPIDIIVGTPGTILDIHNKRKILFTDLSCIVFDEADTMLDSSFRDMTTAFLDSLKQRSQTVPPEVTCVFAAATLPNKNVIGKIKNSIPKLKLLKADIHRVLPHVRHRFIKTSQPEKPELLLEILKSEMEKKKKFMVFVNTSGTCNWLSKFLHENEICHKKLSGKVPPQERHDVFQEYNKKTKGILVCTDIASRGLDSPDLACVINYDCPLNPMDYIHRAGRTGRARVEYSGTPEIVTFLSRNWELNLARSVESAADQMTQIENVDIVKRGNGPIEIKK